MSARLRTALAFAALALAGCGRHKASQITGPAPGSLPWYKLDTCSGSGEYALGGYHWGTLTPAYYLDSSLPADWRPQADAAALTWNRAGSRLQIRKFSTIVTAGQAQDGKSVVSYGPIAGSTLGETRTWYNTTTHVVAESDIKISSSFPMTIGGTPTTYDVVSVLTHEFGHFCGLDHVSDRTQTMYPGMPPDCDIYRTPCEGDVRGLKALYP
jgi:hypothetical protein